jgi:hypothetical protein
VVASVRVTSTSQPGDRLVAAIEAQTVAICRAINRRVLTLLAVATVGAVIMVLVVG